MNKRKILVLCFFPAFSPPTSGGEQRLLNLYRNLSDHYQICLITSTNFDARYELIRHTDDFEEHRIPKDKHWRDGYNTLTNLQLTGDLSGLAMSLAVSDPECAYTKAARAFSLDVDLIVHEFPYTSPIFSDGSMASKEVYNSHNFEVSLFSSIVSGRNQTEAWLKLYSIEKELALRVSKVFATSEVDAEKFSKFYGIPREKIELCPNGYDLTELRKIAIWRAEASTPSRRPRLLFLGSAHYPNVEAAKFLIAAAQRLSRFDVVIAGSVCNVLKTELRPRNIILSGIVDPAMKLRLLADSDVFINPVVLGSGTSLKALEALGSGIPLLSTPEGVRGLDLISGQHATIADREAFPKAVEALLASSSKTQAMAETGRAYAEERFTWARIAADLGTTLDAVDWGTVEARRPTSRPLVLAFNDYPVCSRQSGGQSRIFNLLGSLDADIILVMFGTTFDVSRLAPNIMGVLIAKTAEHKGTEEGLNVGQLLSVNDSTSSSFVSSNDAMRAVVSNLARRVDAVIFEHSYMAPILDVIDAVRPDLPIIYSAHNVESRHRVEMLRAHSKGAKIAAFVERVERQLVSRADLIICCTETDATAFTEMGADTLVVANGCDPVNLPSKPEKLEAREPQCVRVGFLGSSHGPNVEAAQFILRHLAPALPEVSFELVGSVCDAIGNPWLENVVCHGVVDDATKSNILSSWTVALNPVQSGGGSSLKLPDFMAHGLPTISTTAGARGFEVERRGAGLVVDRANFVTALNEILADALGCQRMSEAAFRYAQEDLSWRALAKPYDYKLRELLASSRCATAPQPRRSLLVVTYRYTEPALGGAEEYLIEVLKRLRHRFERIDLAAVDVSQVSNCHHFGSSTTQGSGASSRVAELFDRALFFNAEELSPDAAINYCTRLERAWMRSEFELFLPFSRSLAEQNHLRLLSGFYTPEDHGGGVRRWTAPSFSVLLPRNACTLRLSGFAQRPKALKLTFIRVAEGSVPEIVAECMYQCPVWFIANFSLPEVVGDYPLIVYGQTDEHTSEGDHRPFGLLIDAVSSLASHRSLGADSDEIGTLSEHIADLNDDKEHEVRTSHFTRWVSRLDEMARSNTPEIEADFAAVRGPHSPDLQRWLEQNGSNYDCALVQGIPFDVIPRSVATLNRVSPRPRIVTLPHFHGDDRFYFWRRYLESFEHADATLLFSSSIADILKLPGKLRVVPGGGVCVEEFSDDDVGTAFRNVHMGDIPYFLVLGRKTPSKGYAAIIAAHGELRRRGHTLELILIGPDEDGVVVQGDGVHYLGQQPRAVVRDALRGCIGLVTMSTSESFGIVLCEAWLAGRPVIANEACYAFRELVADGETGWLVSSQARLVAAMEDALLNLEKARSMGQNGRELVLARFTWDKVAESVFETL